MFETSLEAAKRAGLVGRRRVLDSTPLYDAVATMDTVTLVRSAIRGLLKAADADLQTELRGLLARDDDYTAAGKPVCDYEDRIAREALVDALARDAMALVGALDGRELAAELDNAAQLVATVVNEPDDAAEDADTESVAAQQLAVYGDAAYGAGPLLARLENAGARIMTKVQPPPALGGRFAKDRFAIDLAAHTVTCPGQVSVAIRPVKNGGGVAAVRTACAGCPLVAQCTTSPAGRTITISAY